MSVRNSTVFCFGETLVDLLPSGPKPGGAPMNVAYHLNQWGTKAGIITRLGADENGVKLKRFLADKDLDTSFVQTDNSLQTGIVEVALSNNEPSYHIVENVAWDAIEPVQIPDEVELIVHGSLALRSECNKETLKAILSSSRAKVVFDVNFRAPFYSKSLIEEWLSKAHLAKLNEYELSEISEWFDCANSIELINRFPKLELLIVTKGGDGAEVLTRTEQFSHPGYSVQVADTVGSGDAFLATFIHHYLAGHAIPKVLERAYATGAFVATQHGATPTYSPFDILVTIDSQNLVK